MLRGVADMRITYNLARRSRLIEMQCCVTASGRYPACRTVVETIDACARSTSRPRPPDTLGRSATLIAREVVFASMAASDPLSPNARCHVLGLSQLRFGPPLIPVLAAHHPWVLPETRVYE